MIYPSILERRYAEYLPFIEEAAKQVKLTLVNFCEAKRYAFSSRIKTIESLAEKIETGRFKSWSSLDDLFACTIIIPTLLHESEVMKSCKNIFQIERTIKRGQNRKSPDTFTFDATRLYARLRKNEDINNDSELLSIYDITFEIQIKSAFEHASSVSTHDLVYKNDEIDWKKLRLAAQIKANVEQLDTLILAFEQMSPFITESDDPDLKIKRNLSTEINKLFESNKIPAELRPKDMNRFCDNLCRVFPLENKKDKITASIQAIRKEINTISSNKIPRSISLFQYFLAILIGNNIIEFPIKNYYFHITEEFQLLYPSIQTDNDGIFLYGGID
jgi:ppGpp synthetase/RelA/SpoT-type nucleotidyltranferase